MHGPLRHAPRGLRSALPLELTLPATWARSLRRWAAVLLVTLGAGHLLALLLPSVQLLQLLDLSVEQAVGTWVASVLHLVCALLSAAGAVLAHRQGSRWSRNWWLLAAVFLLMSVDETAAIHDRLVVPLRDRFDTGGALLYPWVAVAGVLGLAFLVVQLGFLRNLPRRTGRDLVLAGIVFVVGAAGLEMLEGVVASPGGPGRDSWLYDLLVLAEELLETGALLWVVGILLSYLVTTLDHPLVSVRGSEPVGTAATEPART